MVCRSDQTIISASAKGQEIFIAHGACSNATRTTLVHACGDVLERTRESLSRGVHESIESSAKGLVGGFLESKSRVSSSSVAEKLVRYRLEAVGRALCPMKAAGCSSYKADAGGSSWDRSVNETVRDHDIPRASLAASGFVTVPVVP